MLQYLWYLAMFMLIFLVDGVFFVLYFRETLAVTSRTDVLGCRR